jgi:hypothetical protein
VPSREQMLENKSVARIFLFSQMATLKGGKLLSDSSTGWKEILSFECEHEHKFTLRADTFRSGKWCSVCSYEKMAEKKRGVLKDVIKLEDFKEQILNSGDIIQKADGRGASTRLTILCRNGHTRETTLLAVKNNRSCIFCARDESSKQRSDRIIAIAQTHKIKLSAPIERCNQKIHYVCSVGHKYSKYDSDEKPSSAVKYSDMIL